MKLEIWHGIHIAKEKDEYMPHCQMKDLLRNTSQLKYWWRLFSPGFCRSALASGLYPDNLANFNLAIAPLSNERLA